MEVKKTVKVKKGISRSTLWFIGILLALLGMLSRGMIQGRILQVGAANMEELLSNLEAEGGMTAAAVALALEALESCAVPIFAVLTVDGFAKTSNFRNYLLRVLGVALLSEIPYNYALTGKFIDPSSRNPLFGIVLSLVMLYFYRQYKGRGFMQILVKSIVFAAVLFWAMMIGVKFGVMMLFLVTVLWGFQNRPSLRYWIASAAAVCCCVGNPLYMFTPFGFLPAYLYNEEPGRQNRVLQYLMYPILLVLIGVVS